MAIKFAVVIMNFARYALPSTIAISREEFCSRFKFFLCCVYNCRGDPFEVDPLPKSFYHPSMQRELSEAERKVRQRNSSGKL